MWRTGQVHAYIVGDTDGVCGCSYAFCQEDPFADTLGFPGLPFPMWCIAAPHAYQFEISGGARSRRPKIKKEMNTNEIANCPLFCFLIAR